MNTPWFNYFISELRSFKALYPWWDDRDEIRFYPPRLEVQDASAGLIASLVAGVLSGYLDNPESESIVRNLLFEGSHPVWLDMDVMGEWFALQIAWAYSFSPIWEQDFGLVKNPQPFSTIFPALLSLQAQDPEFQTHALEGLNIFTHKNLRMIPHWTFFALYSKEDLLKAYKEGHEVLPLLSLHCAPDLWKPQITECDLQEWEPHLFFNASERCVGSNTPGIYRLNYYHKVLKTLPLGDLSRLHPPKEVPDEVLIESIRRWVP